MMLLHVVLHPHDSLERHVTTTLAFARLLDVQLGIIFVLLLTSRDSAGSLSRDRGVERCMAGMLASYSSAQSSVS
jgi:hypothetical protein